MIDPRLQLHDALRSADAEPVAAFSALADERQALAQGAGLYPRAGRQVWRVTGADAVDYLHRMLTQDVQRIAVPGGARACLLNRQGRVLGDFLLWRLEEGLVLDGEPTAAQQALPVLEKFVIADDVTFEEITSSQARFVLAGPQAAAALESCAIPVPALGAITRIEAAGSVCDVLAVPHGGDMRFECLAPRDGVVAFVDALLENPSVRPVAEDAFEYERVRIQEPHQPNELDDETLFNESQLEAAVSWSKGCYPGQEPVVMAKHRGKPPHLLVALQGDGTPPVVGAALSAQGRSIGRITSVASGDQAWIGLGYVRAAIAEAPQPLELSDGSTCTFRG